MPTPRQIPAFRRALLAWFDANRRDLPWRRTRDPYAIWLSEVMLQQTTVRAVEPRWRRFLERFPTIRALAEAPPDAVLAEWSGLGYYARARNLHAAARRAAEDFGGALPTTFEGLLALPGMGRYTASAVASIAHGEPVAVLDANVERVLARLDAEEGDPKSAPVKRRLWGRAQELLEPRRPGPWNEAVMELGAVVCLPAAPQCPACPVGRWCKARAGGEPRSYPRKAPKPPMEEAREAAVVLRRGGKVLVLKRPPTGSFAGMWELPRGARRDGEPGPESAARIAREAAGVDARPRREVLRIKHVVMRRSIRLSVWEADLAGAARVRAPGHDAHEWIDPAEWIARPISTTQKRIARWLLGEPEEADAPSKADGLDLFEEGD